jgi:hypothetical protein
MSVPTFFELIEGEKALDEYILTNEDLDEIEDSIPFLKKMIKSFNGTPESLSFDGTEYDRRDGLMGLLKNYQGFEINLISPNYGRNVVNANDSNKVRNGLGPTFSKLEKEGGVEIIPDIFQGILRLSFLKDKKLDLGEVKMKPLIDFDTKHQIIFDCNYNSLFQVKDIIEKALDDFFELCKDVRIVIVPKYFIKNRGFKKELKEEFKTLYLELLEKFKNQGYLSVDDIDDDILGLVLLKVAKDNEEYLEILNDLPDDIKKGFFRYANKIFGEDPIVFGKDSIKLIRNIYNLRSAWDFI